MSNINLIIEERAVNIGKFMVGRLLPFRQKRMVGPFIYIDHMGPVKLNERENFDVMPHPHIGLSTLTFLFEGNIMHRDTLGTEVEIKSGAVNWMTAGKGVQHSEMFPLVYEDKENPMELFQIWLNLPSKSKNVEPHFKMMWGEKIPKITYKDLQNRETKIEVIVGNLPNTKANTPPPNSWAANPQNEVAVWNIKLQSNAEFVLPKASKGINRTLYFYEGDEILIDNVTVNRYHSVEVLSHVDLKINNKNHPSSILVLQGKPINEPVIQYGPFVMNTKEEIHQAFDFFGVTSVNRSMIFNGPLL